MQHQKLQGAHFNVEHHNQTAYFNVEEISKLSDQWQNNHTMNAIPLFYGTLQREAYSLIKEKQMGLSEWIWKESIHGCNNTDKNLPRCDLFGGSQVSTMEIKQLVKDVQLLTQSMGRSMDTSVYTSGQHVLASAHCASGTQFGLQCLQIISSRSLPRDIELSTLQTK